MNGYTVTSGTRMRTVTAIRWPTVWESAVTAVTAERADVGRAVPAAMPRGSLILRFHPDRIVLRPLLAEASKRLNVLARLTTRHQLGKRLDKSRILCFPG